MLRLVCLVAALCSLQAVHGLQVAQLDLQADGVRVTATAECRAGTEYAVCRPVEDNCVRTCGRGGGGDIAHNPELAVDGNRSTSWQSPPLSFYEALGETIGSHNLTIDLGRPVHVVELQVWSGEGELPVDLELHHSLDGDEFTLLASLGPGGGLQVTASVLNITGEQQELTTDQRAASHIRYLRLRFLAPPTLIVPSEPRTGFYSVGEVEVRGVEEGVCPPFLDPPEECYGEPVSRRTHVILADPALHRLLWQRANQSSLWSLDDVMVLVEMCAEGIEGCEGGRVREDFNGTLNPLLWDSDSFPVSSSFGSRSCPNSRDPALLVPPGGQITSRPLLESASDLISDVEFLSLPVFCRGAEYSPVEVRQCRSIEGVLGECRLLALVSSSECGNCLDQLTFQLRTLQESMDSALFPANLTLLDELHTDIHSTLTVLETLEAWLAVLEVAIGILTSPPPSVLPLPPSVLRLDLLLVPPVLRKLQDLKDLTELMPNIPVVLRDDLTVFYSDLRTRLESLLTEANQLRAQQITVSSSVVGLLSSVSDDLEAVSVARETANQIVILISSRQYSATESRVQMLASNVLQILEVANRFFGLAQSNAEHARDVSHSLMAISGRLMTAKNLTTDTVGVANEAAEFLRQALLLEQAVMALSREAVEVLDRGEVLLGEGGVAVTTGGQLLMESRELYMNASQSLPDITALSDRLGLSLETDRPRLLRLVQTTDCRAGRDNCTAGEEHGAELAADHAYIVNSSVSVFTLRHATDTLAALNSSGMPLDVTLINRTALLAQETARDALNQLAEINTTVGGVVSIVLSSARQLNESASESLSTSASLLSTITIGDQRRKLLTSALDEQQMDLFLLNGRIGGVASLEPEELLLLLQRANSSVEEVRSAGERVEGVRDGAEGVRDDIPQITDNVQRAESLVQDTEQRFPLVSRLLSATERQAQAALSNVTRFIAQNDRIVRDIDTLIAQLSSVYSSIALINSPVRLSSEPAAANDTVPYLSLQPPPGQQLGGAVQFEDLDLYMWSSAQYQTPSLIFYAGPVRFPDQQNGTRPETREDVVWVIAEEDHLRLGWELGGYRANRTYPARVEGESQLRLTRVGSQFRLQFSPSSDDALQVTSQLNGSLLFHTSDRTAYLLGGWPQGAELGSAVMPLPLSSLRGFEGQFQLALFNGELWGLWSVRSTSATDLIGQSEFRRNELSRDVTWHADPGFSRTASTLSFDGAGYLFTQQFGDVTDFAVRAIFQTINLYLRPNNARRGLAMYAYQPQEGVSVEVFLRDGRVNVLICRHDNSMSEVLVNHTEAVSRDEEVLVRIRYVRSTERYIINGREYTLSGNTAFFTNLREVRAWFGGVRDDQLDSTYIPHERTGYFGCVDVYVQRNFDTLYDIFRGAIFTQYYLNSPQQSGLSATCYATVYVREVSFGDGAEGMEYTYLPLPPRNSLCEDASSPLSLSLSVLPLEEDGFILEARDYESSSAVRVVLKSGVVEVTVTAGTDSLSLSSQEPLELETWHHLLLSLSPGQEPQFSLFVDGLLQETTPSTLSDFSLDLLTSAPVTGDLDPVLFVGGVKSTFNNDVTIPTFRGCMRDLTFDLCPLSFQAPSLVVRYPPGVRYHSCPAAIVVTSPELPVRPALPQQRVCLGAGPDELGSTHGGFTKETQLLSSNVVGLFGSQWNLTFNLRQRSAGHVISVRSVSGERVRVDVVEGGRLMLTVSSESGSEMTSTSAALFHDIFTSLGVRCAVLPLNLTCTLTVAGQPAPVTAEVAVDVVMFDPALPVTVGLVTARPGSTVNGFEGCISDLAINGDMAGFKGVETGIPCYQETVAGLGLTGISRISHLLPAPSSPEAGGEVVVSLTVRPLLETGVVAILTIPVTAQPVLAVGLVQGELRVSNFTDDQYFTLAEGLCDPANVMTFELIVSYTESRLSVGVAGSPSLLLSSTNISGELVLTIGNVPVGLPATVVMSFLVSEDMLPAVQPAGLDGCLLSHAVPSGPLSLATAENVLNGFCPDG